MSLKEIWKTRKLEIAVVMLLLLWALAVTLHGQATNNRYIATANTTALTVQQPATDAKQVRFTTASAFCSVASTATWSWNGTAATATTLTPKRVPQTFLPASATAWSGSNVGAGTTGVVYNVPAGQTFPWDISHIVMGNQGTSTNLSLTTSNSCTITMEWLEQ